MCRLGSCDDNIFSKACNETISNGVCPHFGTLKDRDVIVKNIKPWIDSSQKVGTFKKVVFNLKRTWVVDGKTVDLYEEIKSGRKTSEWRDATNFWAKRLINRDKLSYNPILINQPRIVPYESIKPRRAWFVVGYPKNNVPRLEADITAVIYHPSTNQYEIQFTHIQEIEQ
jgi:hypothetical protein